MPTCPAGHQSGTADYCDTCGAAIGAAGPSEAGPSAPAPAGPVPPGPACPECGSPRSPADAFCEVCGLDFATGARPAPPPPPGAAGPGALPGTGWSAVVSVDPEFFATNQTDDAGLTLAPPTGVTTREVPLTGAEVRIGRGEDAHGLRPEIDLSLAPGDPGVSHRHAVLSRRGDGWVVVDVGSTNGTRVGPATSTPIAPQVEVRLNPGDHILIGVWTRVTLRGGNP